MLIAKKINRFILMPNASPITVLRLEMYLRQKVTAILRAPEPRDRTTSTSIVKLIIVRGVTIETIDV